MSPPSRGAWIEISLHILREKRLAESPPSRGAWIEMRISVLAVRDRIVAPLAGGVD